MAIEDLTTYTEVDSDGDITVTSSKCDVSSLKRIADSSVYKDFGADNFGALTHDFEVLWSARLEPFPIGMVWHVSDTAASTLQTLLDNTDGFGVFLNSGAAETDVFLTLQNFIDTDGDDFDGPTVDTLYYVTIERVPSTLTCKIYSDSGRTTLVDTLTVTYNVTTLRYLGVCASRESAAFEDSFMTYYTQNFDLDPVVGANAPTADLQGPLIGPLGGPIMVNI